MAALGSNSHGRRSSALYKIARMLHRWNCSIPSITASGSLLRRSISRLRRLQFDVSIRNRTYLQLHNSSGSWMPYNLVENNIENKKRSCAIVNQEPLISLGGLVFNLFRLSVVSTLILSDNDPICNKNDKLQESFKGKSFSWPYDRTTL